MRKMLLGPNASALILGRQFRVDDPEAKVSEQPRETVRPTASKPTMVISTQRARVMEKNNRFAEKVQAAVHAQKVLRDAGVVDFEADGTRITPG